MGEAMHYMGYMALKVTHNDIPIWNITMNGENVLKMAYYDTSMENIRTFTEIINELVSNHN